MQRDPTASEAYIALRNALLAIQDDASAVHSVLSSQSDGGAAWLSAARYELRRSLVQGRLREAESLGRLIGVVLDVREQGARDELSENRLHSDAMGRLVDGIGAILGQDVDSGFRLLEELTEAVYCDDSLRWVAWLYTAKAGTEKGDLVRAKRAADAALALASRLDPLARGTSLCTIAEVEFLSGLQEAALRHLTEASAVFDQIGDARGKATASLTRARLLGRLHRDDEAVEAARQAQAADADWDEPAVFLSEWLLGRELCDAAEAAIQPFVESGPVAPRVQRQARLIQALRSGEVPAAVMRAYLDYSDRVPSEADLPALKALWESCKHFDALREHLAWTLARLGHDDEARQHFEQLAESHQDPAVKASALLGLGCLASRRFGHRQSSARVRAAASASQREPSSAEPPRIAPLDAATLEQAITQQPPRERRPSWEGRTQPVKVATTPPPTLSAPAPKAVFTGDLQMLGVPDLLEFLKSSRRTGTLVVTSAAGIGAVHLRQGMITGAASPNSKNMGQLLLEGGQVTEQQLRDAAAFQQADSPNRLIGSILLERGQVDRETLQRALAAQIKGAVAEMVGWTAGRFAFEPDKRGQTDESEVEVELDTQDLLMEVLAGGDQPAGEEGGDGEPVEDGNAEFL